MYGAVIMVWAHKRALGIIRKKAGEFLRSYVSACRQYDVIKAEHRL